jgi:hypothetical protein
MGCYGVVLGTYCGIVFQIEETLFSEVGKTKFKLRHYRPFGVLDTQKFADMLPRSDFWVFPELVGCAKSAPVKLIRLN